MKNSSIALAASANPRHRSDGWSTDVQCRFIEALALTGSVTAAAQAVDRHLSSAYRLRARPEAAAFRAAWNAASGTAYQRLHDLAMDRAVSGIEEPVLDKDGICVFRKTVYDNRLLMFLMNHLRPQGEPCGADGFAGDGGGADALAGALAALEAAPADLDRLTGPLAGFAFTPEEAAALADHGIAVGRIEAAPPESLAAGLDLAST